MAETITIHGLREVQGKLRTLPLRMKDRVILGALRQGANRVRQAIQASAPVKSGRLRRGVVVRNSKIHNGRMSDDLIGVYITIKSKKKGDPFYGRFQEDGWKAGKARKSIPGKEFIEKAWVKTRDDAVELIARSSIAGTELLARKLGL